MAQGAITRLTYERLGILLTDAPAYKENGSKIRDLLRVQSFDYGFAHESLDVKAIGSDSLLTRKIGGQSPIVRAPNVNCNIEYYFCEGRNENSAGLYIGKDGSILKNIITSTTTDDINIMVVASHSDSHKDLNLLSNESDFNDYNVVGFGNAFLTNYSYNASIGSIPTSSLAYTAGNLRFDIYDENNRPEFPSVKLGNNNALSPESLALTPGAITQSGGSGTIFSEYQASETSAVRPGDVKIRMIKSSGGRGGADLQYVLAAVQNISINLPIPRQDIYGMGSNYVFNRKLKLPIIGEMSVDMVLRGYTQDEVDSFLTEADVFEVKIDQPIKSRFIGEVGDIYLNRNKLFVIVEEGLWKSIGFAIEERELGLNGQSYVSLDSNFYYVCVEAHDWAKIPLTTSNVNYTGYNIGDRVVSRNFVHVYTYAGWRKFPLTEVNFEDLILEDAFLFANNISFEINRAQLKSQNYTHSIGSEVMVSSTMTFDVTKNDGMSLYFRFVPKIAPSWYVKSETIDYTENSTAVIDLDDAIDIGDSPPYYNLIGEDADKLDLVNRSLLAFRSPPDYETQNTYNIRIAAINDAGADYKDVVINILNVNEFPAVWTTKSQQISYTENDTIDVPYTIDLEFSDSPIVFSLAGADDDAFNIDSNAGTLSFKNPPDYETQTGYFVNLVASNALASSTKSLTIAIQNVVEFTPLWSGLSETVEYTERDTINVPYFYDLNPRDADPVTYSLSGADAASFEIDSTGALSFKSAPDYETQTGYFVDLVASNSIGASVDSIKHLTIAIQNVVEFTPLWSGLSETVEYTERDTINVPYFYDLDPRDADPVTYSLSGVDAESFTVDSTGALSFVSSPDYETQTGYFVDLVASNTLGSSTKSLTIAIQNVVDLDPVWGTPSETIYYQGEDNLAVSYVNDPDPVDIDGTITGYGLFGADASEFNINSTNGALAFNSAPDYHDQSTFNITITAYNEYSSVDKSITLNILGEFSFADNHLVVQTSGSETRRTAYTIETLASGSTLDQLIDANSDYFYVCISGTSWAKIALADSDLGYTGYAVGDKVIHQDFVHIYTNEGWKKFAITE